MRRRTFLKTALAAGVAAGTHSIPGLNSMIASTQKSSIPRRKYRDEVELSILGFGGILVMGHTQTEAGEMVAEAVDRGLNYFDVAPSYGGGEAEEKLGPALAPHRQKVFLACKTGERLAPGVRRELERSLKRMKTDHFDLYQLHAVTT